MSAETLRTALAREGVDAEVEARGRLAVLRASSPDQWTEARRRAVAVTLAADHGFTHVALELSAADAAVRRD
ncbi:MAG: hypothetical protein ABJD07_13785 [Gemmatimonadaceae bacterium]